MKCNQQALFRYTWAGRDESFCCLEHAQQLQGVAQAIGYYVQLIPLSGDEQMKVSCSQEVKANEAICICTHDVYESAVNPGHCMACGKPLKQKDGD